MVRERWVRVEWDDASISHAERTREESCKRSLVRCITVGHLIIANRERVVVSHELQPGDKGDEDSYRHTTTIPRGMVRKVTRLRADE